MPVNYGVNPNATALDVAFSIHTAVDAAFYDMQYPDREWYTIVDPNQIKTDVNAGATSYGYVTRQLTGSAAFIGNGPNDNIPMVAQGIGAVTVPVAYAAVGSQITQEDARQYAFGFDGNLPQDLGMAMREAMDNLMETSIIFGQPALQFNGWINYPGITVDTAATGASGQTAWTTKTGEEMVKDINDALAAMWESTKGIMKPLDVFIPMKQFALLSNVPMALGGTNLVQTAQEFIVTNNIMHQITGEPLRLHPSRYLAGAGTAGADRMVIMDRTDRNQLLPFPLPYQLSQPVPEALGVQWYAEAKFGSYHVREQGSIRYVDGI